MSSASKVGEIFTAAGAAFSKLGELTMQLHPSTEPAPGGGKWTDQEIESLRQAVNNFGTDLNKISESIKVRTVSQIRTQLKKKAYEEAGLSPPSAESPTQKTIKTTTASQEKCASVTIVTGDGEPQAKKQKTSEVTLSALNAPEGDVDIEGLSDQGAVKAKLDFDSDVDSSIL